MAKQAKLTPIPKPLRRPNRNHAIGSAKPTVEKSAAPDLSHIHPSLHPLAVRTADLAFLADNPLDHDDGEIEEMRAILRARGQISPLHVNRRSAPPVVLGGNKRLRAMLAENWEWVAVVNLDLDDDDAAALAVELNASQGLLWNNDLLGKAIDRISKLNLGEHRQTMMKRLAQARGLLKAPEPAADGAEQLDLSDDENPEAEFLAPFPWFGGKSRVASLIWRAFGDVANYTEPFFGSGAALLRRPLPFKGTETVNDADGLVCNFWRAVQADPKAVAKFADWPVNESDLHARHVWLVERKESLQSKLEGDKDFFDAETAGLWAWGMACWIGSGFCSGNGPWRVVEAEDGSRKLVHLGNAGQGVNRKRVHLSNAGRGVNRKRVHLSNAGQGVNRKLVHLGNAGQGVNRKLVHLSNAGQDSKPGRGECGLLAWMQALSERLKRVRVCCGDWTRVCGGDSGDALKLFFVSGQTCGVFLDPPYADTAGRDPTLYRKDSETVAHAVREWAICHGDDKRLRIALCGYEGEHQMPKSWQCVGWKAQGGYENQSDKPNENCKRERIWLSPGCNRLSS